MRFKKIIIAIICVLLCISFTFLSYSYAESSYIWSDNSDAQILETNSNNNSTDLKLESGGAILVEQSTGTVLYDHNSHEQFRPASVTKVMSLVLIMEAIDNR